MLIANRGESLPGWFGPAPSYIVEPTTNAFEGFAVIDGLHEFLV